MGLTSEDATEAQQRLLAHHLILKQTYLNSFQNKTNKSTIQFINYMERRPAALLVCDEAARHQRAVCKRSSAEGVPPTFQKNIRKDSKIEFRILEILNISIT